MVKVSSTQNVSASYDPWSTFGLLCWSPSLTYFPQSRPCLSAKTHSCVTSRNAGPSWVALPGSQPAHTFSVISTGPVSSAAPLPSAQPAPLRCLGSWTLWGRSFRPRRSTKPWFLQVCDQTLSWTSVPVLWPSGAIRSNIFLSVCQWTLLSSVSMNLKLSMSVQLSSLFL